MINKDFYEKLSISEINKGIEAFINYGPIKAGSIEISNFNLYKLLYAYFGDIELRKKMNQIAEEF